MDDIYVVGTGGFASEVTEYIVERNDFNIAGYFGNDCEEYLKYSYKAPFLGSEDGFSFNVGDKIVVAIAESKLRKKITAKLAETGCIFPLISASNVFVGKKAEIGKGAILCPLVTITSNAKIGENFHANIYSYVAHDCVIGDNVTFAPSVKCNGNVHIENDVYIGTGSIIFQGKPDKPLVIGEGAVVAAGSVVTKSVSAGITVFGNPAVEFTKENIKRRS